MLNPILIECSKLAQKKYMTKCDWLRKAIHWKLCKRLKLDSKWYMLKPESFLENDMYPLEVLDTNESPNSSLKTRPSNG